MFGTPERVTQNNVVQFYVPLVAPVPLDVELEYTNEMPSPELSIQHKISYLQESVLQGLTRHKTIFKTNPNYESLKGICPTWGIILQDAIPSWSPYTSIIMKSVTTKPCYVDLVLRGVYISRSTISPHFEAIFRKAFASEVDDLEWDETVGTSEITEVDDMPVESGTLVVKGPAVMEREKRAAKERVHEAFRVAAAARETAEREAELFYAKYDLSDSESAFSEWMSDNESDEQD